MGNIFDELQKLLLRNTHCFGDYLWPRKLSRLEEWPRPAQVDALDEDAVERHIAEVVKKAGTVDISFNALPLSPVCRPRG